MNTKNEVFEYLIDQLRQQVNTHQCEDLAHEVQSLKNRLRDMSAQIKELHLALAQATGDVEAYKLIYKGGYAAEQSGCRKEDVQECDHNWIIAPGLFIAEGHKDNVPSSRFCCECGAREWDDKDYKPKNDTQKCKHEWDYYYPNGEEHRCCAKCGAIAE